MNCLDFRRLALSDPSCSEASFVSHSLNCPDCLTYLNSVRHMDADLAKSLDVEMPDSLMAKLELAQIQAEEDEETTQQTSGFRRYAIAASFAAALFVSGFFRQ